MGKLSATHTGNKWSNVYVKSLQRDKIKVLKSNSNFDGFMQLSEQSKQDLLFWINNIHGASQSYDTRPISLTVHTDSSITGWGYIDSVEKRRYGEMWDEDYARSTNINALEIEAILQALRHMGESAHNQHIQIFVDNTSAIANLVKGGSTKSTKCNNITRLVSDHCQKHNIKLSPVYINTSDNTEADAASRAYTGSNVGEWSLCQHAFDDIVGKFGKPDIDYFASDLNHKCELYVTRFHSYEAHATDALCLPWYGTNGYFFPPFNLVSSTLAMMVSERPTGILLVPDWPSQPWYPLLQQLMPRPTIRIPVGPGTLHLRHKPRTQFPMINRLTLIAVKL